MAMAPIPGGEIEGLEARGDFAVLDTPPEEAFNLIVRVFALVSEAPAPPISLGARLVPCRESGFP